jgi:lipid A 3-O-deacylase
MVFLNPVSTMIRKIALAAALALGAISNTHALDSVSVEAGEGNEDTDLWRLGLQWNWQRRWLTARSWTLGAYWDLQAGRWSGPLQPGQSRQDVWDIGITPVFRLERAARTAAVPYVEAAVGFHLLSDLRVNFRRNFSTRFQFGDHLGAGVRFGPDQRYDASVRFQHLSNGGLARPNPGINFLQLRLAYRFE